jgi:hypothetical protein
MKFAREVYILLLIDCQDTDARFHAGHHVRASLSIGSDNIIQPNLQERVLQDVIGFLYLPRAM